MPGYYRVLLQDDSINAELTATQRVGVHRYTYYNKEKASKVFLDLDHSANKGSWGTARHQCADTAVGPSAIEGYRIITGWGKLRKIYFYAGSPNPSWLRK